MILSEFIGDLLKLDPSTNIETEGGYLDISKLLGDTKESNSELDQRIRDYKEILDKKENLDALTKENNKAKEQAEQKICAIMVDEEKPDTTVDGFKYSLTQKVMYSKKSEADLMALEAETKKSFHDILREQGLGDIIKETVNAQTLQSTISRFVDELEENNEELPEELADCLNIYEKLSIAKRKANTKALDRAKANKEA